ncbi:DivIVA domain-containing protein [Isoptericola cucumis]|uniref:Cell wall synthesis protein Wag31 n=1 Tax=Isoptericola cucumis TaxID=1776856 RepID=A0ABQ2B7D1_9MICO|nr:DivIVA domain-containing protein [Isoptericola cucumis]GGI07743.1 DivIVA domain-containing protein [Isoptericola cucumis]
MSSLFSTVSALRNGYEKDEVDEFFDHARQAYEGRTPEPLTHADIQSATFELVRRGYDTHEVDQALDRLESAFIARQRAEYVAAHGQDAWMAALADRARTLYGRLGRPDGEKFAPAERGKQGYDVDDVDALCDRLVAYFDRQEPLTAAEVRSATFGRAKGADAYAEASVDRFLARATEVLLGVE